MTDKARELFRRVRAEESKKDSKDLSYFTTPEHTSRKTELPSLKRVDYETIEKAKESSVFKDCVRIMTSNLPEEESDISDYLLDLFLRHKIHNSTGLSLLEPDEIPDVNTHELWNTSTFRSGFKMTQNVSTRMDINRLTTFQEICENYISGGNPSKRLKPLGLGGDIDEIKSQGSGNNEPKFNLKDI